MKKCITAARVKKQRKSPLLFCTFSVACEIIIYKIVVIASLNLGINPGSFTFFMAQYILQTFKIMSSTKDRTYNISYYSLEPLVIS